MSENNPVKLKAKERGQGLVEFALILPLFLLLVWGIIEFGRLLVMYTEVSNAAREAVRYGVARGLLNPQDPEYHFLDCEGIRNHGKAVTGMVALDDGDFEIGYDRGDGVVFARCEDQPPDIVLGDRMVITVTHQIRPLVLFQNAGPFRMQFTAARTIVHQGMPMERVGSEGGIEEAPELEFHLTISDTCSGYFTWTAIAGASNYEIWRTTPLPSIQIDTPTGLRYPSAGSVPNVMSWPDLENGQEYRVRASNWVGDGPFSNIVEITGCAETLPAPTNFTFTRDQPSPCSGTFTWDPVTGAAGYHIYRDGILVYDVSAPPLVTSTLVTNAGYTIRAYDSDGAEGSPSSLVITNCQPEAPQNLVFHPDQATPPCLGHLTWNNVTGADRYRVYRNGAGYPGSPEGAPTTSRYPGAVGSTTAVANGDRFEVTAYNSAGGMESDLSDPVIVAGCWLGTEGPVTYWLHSSPSPPSWHGNAPPPLGMNETRPSLSHVPPYHDVPYDYNHYYAAYDDPAAMHGREIAAHGGTPPGETDPDNYLEWRSPSTSHPVTFTTNAVLTIWGRNPTNSVVDSTAYLYYRDDPTGSYWYLAQASYTFARDVTEWTQVTYTFGVNGLTVPAGNRLVVWLVAPGAKSLHYIYDMLSYDSRLEFRGRWGS